jgi:hypothetical protein
VSRPSDRTAVASPAVPKRLLVERVQPLRRFGPRRAEWSNWDMDSSQSLGRAPRRYAAPCHTPTPKTTSIFQARYLIFIVDFAAAR